MGPSLRHVLFFASIKTGFTLFHELPYDYHLSVRCFIAMNFVRPCKPTHDRLMIKDWHGFYARVCPCSIAKPK